MEKSGHLVDQGHQGFVILQPDDSYGSSSVGHGTDAFAVRTRS
jgi:hypothetical protein